MFRIYFLYSLGITIGSLQWTEAKSLHNKVAVVTGAAQGLGYAIADNFLTQGVRFLIIVDKQYEKGHDAAAQLNRIHHDNRAVFIHGDVRYDLEKVFHRIWKEYEYVDVLVNNAGVLNEYSPEDTINTNTLASIQWSLKFWHNMRKDRGGRGGTIMNMASETGYLIFPFVSVYTASKHGVVGFSRNLGHEYTSRHTRVRVLALCPGFTISAMTGNPKVTLEQFEDFKKFMNASTWQKPDNVGKGAVEVFENAKSGTAWTIEGGNPPVEAPDSMTMTVDYINSLL